MVVRVLRPVAPPPPGKVGKVEVKCRQDKKLAVCHGRADVAKSLGATGVVVKNLGDVGEQLDKAIDRQMRQGKTTILDLHVTRELGDPFRRDALKKPRRLLKKYEHTNVA